jgi:hypothetical protein
MADAKKRFGIRGDEQDGLLRDHLRRTAADIELLAGRSFGGGPTTKAMEFELGVLPFVEISDLDVGAFQATAGCWPIPDPVRPETATVLQLGAFEKVRDRADPTPAALGAAGMLVAHCNAEGRFTDAIWQWMAQQPSARPSNDRIRRLLDPEAHVQVPVATAGIGGWWIQVSRRIRLVTKKTPADQRLVEVLIQISDDLALTAAEPILIVARVTEQPVTWAMATRIWTIRGFPTPGPWRLKGFAGLIREYGLPILSVDDATTPAEAVAQLLLAAHWHGYLRGEEQAIPPALALAFPREVGWVRRGTGSPDDATAATLLFERLLHPGFDPTRSTDTIRHYVRRHASTLVRAYRASEAPSHRWDDLGINERHYYKLLRKFAAKTLDGRYDVDERTIEQMRGYLENRARRKAALELLQRLGFGEAAARKWLQRHEIASIKTAKPRRPRTGH